MRLQVTALDYHPLGPDLFGIQVVIKDLDASTTWDWATTSGSQEALNQLQTALATEAILAVWPITAEQAPAAPEKKPPTCGTCIWFENSAKAYIKELRETSGEDLYVGSQRGGCFYNPPEAGGRVQVESTDQPCRHHQEDPEA